MKPVLMEPLPKPLETSWRVPGSKSITNRALILAALHDGETELRGCLHSDDTKHMRNALVAMGIEIEVDGTTLKVKGGVDKLKAPKEDIFIGNSGTSVRFLTGLAALLPGPVTFVGDEYMAVRPLGDLVDALRQLGVEVDCPTGCPPLTIKGNGSLAGGKVTMNGSKSSQYFSALMLMGGCAKGPIEIQVEGTLVSLPYVKMTMQMVEDFGGKIVHHEDKNSFTVQVREPVASSDAIKVYVIEPDASTASYPFALAAATGSKIEVPAINEKSIQGDFGFVHVLEKMGCTVSTSAEGTTLQGPPRGELEGIEIDMHHISDTVMSLAAIAPLCKGPVKITNVANIRIKETDRLEATVNELKRLGQDVENGDDWLEIKPGKPVQPCSIECYGDHRMAMSFGILGKAVPGITITDSECTAKTYPEFFKDLDALCAEVDPDTACADVPDPKRAKTDA
ncbi:Pentafunctional AROM polypeptide [Hondaea fermentalgiana]|uniref:3-phosphoshikimate 1-carboxyvinyltransferase n=1 Tax=Hondaea fermentalgiana TaxID=2315210 RepID=A0A2R5GK90_9STRA|nr:Pentafunctional AROM polypeptide [Hondaea fermentalgiana]|eukprot:GBG30739.1 Pentafunctional AROM polypeptide [Hondaea fermentalgiana]